VTANIRFLPAKDDLFLAEVRSRVDALLNAPGVRHRAALATATKNLSLCVCVVVAYAGIVTAGGSEFRALSCTILFGLFALLLAINVGHDAAHHSLVKGNFLNQLLQCAAFLPLGVDAYLWRLRHARSHHMFPNVNGCDIDIDHNPFFRLSPNQPSRWYFRHQAAYAPVMYCLVALHTIWWQDLAYLRKKDLANLRDLHHGRLRVAQFVLCKFLYVALVLAVPLLALSLPWWDVVLNYLAANFAVSLMFVFLLIGTHFSTEAEFPAPSPDGSLPFTWSEHVLRTSVDWSPSSLITFWLGGINAHAAHHLFPHLPHAYYGRISPIIEDAARAFGLPYHRTSFTGIVDSHFRFLARLGRPVPQVMFGKAG
jgi:linoleoyl-CoA desaturase